MELLGSKVEGRDVRNRGSGTEPKKLSPGVTKEFIDDKAGELRRGGEGNGFGWVLEKAQGHMVQGDRLVKRYLQIGDLSRDRRCFV